MNITDIGHLTSDADAGEDKMMKALKREGLKPTKESMLKLANKYADAFKEDLKNLNILPPLKYTKATEHVKEMIELIKRLEKNNLTYKGKNGNIYFDTSKFKHYHKLAGSKSEDTQARVETDENKKNSEDFVLWFAEEKFQNHIMQWDSKFGVGFPGWHIECSAMSMKYLGEHFDIHCGGIDHIPVHHTNEIAQSEGATGKKWVNYWCHNEFLILDKGKMSKSSGTFLTLQSLLDKGYSALDYRYFNLGTHYRKQLMFSFEGLDSARNALKKLQDLVLELKSKKDFKGSPKKYITSFEKELANDLNTPNALATAWQMLKDSSLGSKEKYTTILQFDKVFGLKLKDLKKDSIPAEIKQLAKEREQARKDKDFAKSDKLRNQIKSKGYEVKDTPDGPELKKI